VAPTQRKPDRQNQPHTPKTVDLIPKKAYTLDSYGKDGHGIYIRLGNPDKNSLMAIRGLIRIANAEAKKKKGKRAPKIRSTINRSGFVKIYILGEYKNRKSYKKMTGLLKGTSRQIEDALKLLRR
jgi:hypothetical protein